MSSRKIEMHWTCSACGHRNLGRHKECVRCGDPKDKSEKYEMPSDTAAAPTVTDPALLRMAHAGPDWRCSYCGYDQRKLDGSCQQCGAAQAEGQSVRAVVAAVPAAPLAKGPLAKLTALFATWPKWLAYMIVGVAGPGIVCLGCVIAGLVIDARGSQRGAIDPSQASPHVLHESVAAVVDRRWEHTVRVERWQIVDREGFAENRPVEAFEVRSLGMRHHHDEQVFDHMGTETYSEQVPYQDTETYTEQVRCGEDCTDLPEHCTEHCTSDENGFATCSTSCSGGGRSCSPRYCSETRTRQVTRYRSETRTRQVPVYRTEPREAEWFAWKQWDWVVDRVARAEGGAAEPLRWPSAEELAPATPLGEGQREREQREGRYRVTFRDSYKRRHEVTLQNDAELARYEIGSEWRARTSRSGQGFSAIAPL